MSVLQSEAVVLGRMPYKETSYIVHLFTRHAGRVDGIISGVRKKKARVSAGLLQPGQLVELQCSYKDPTKLQRITQIKPLYVYQKLLADVKKSTVALFVGELLQNILRSPQADEELYIWIQDFFMYLDQTKTSVANFPIYFLAELTLYLGIQPSAELDQNFIFFDLMSGVQTDAQPAHLYFIEGESCKAFASFVELDLTEAHGVPMNTQTRRAVLQAWIDYYRIHLESFRELKSTDILKSIFSVV